MTGALRFISAAEVSLEELAAAFTAAFAGYFYPMTLSAEQLSRRVRFEQLDQVTGTLRIINEPATSSFNAPLSAHGFRETERQHEMVMALEKQG
jgi:hypothetical protein